MRAANVDLRPFAGVPFAPSNTFATTLAPSRTTGMLSATIERYPEAPLPQPEPVATSAYATARPLSLAQLLSSR